MIHRLGKLVAASGVTEAVEPMSTGTEKPSAQAEGPTGECVRLEGVTQRFDGEAVFEDVSLSIHAGEVLAIIGPSGAGKTTLLRLLGLFQQPDEGTVRVDGVDVWTLSERERRDLRRRIGMVFQEPNLFDASVRHNVGYGLRVRRRWQERIRRAVGRLAGESESQTVAEALETVGLEQSADQPARSLSGGEAQRVAFARALAYGPEVLLLDEPTSDLDPRNTAVLEEATAAARTREIGAAIATHDMHQAKRIADRTAVLLDGSIIEAGPTDRVFEAPNDPRARKFIDGELVY
ncbi:MAG: phosphate ABC transporter ATP-binding protein [Natronomonas sp.]